MQAAVNKSGLTLPKLVAALWLLAGVATLLAAIATAYVGAFGAPFWDQWWFTNPDRYLANLFERHNAHPIVLGKLVFAADYLVFDAQPWFLQALIFIALAGAVWAFVALARLMGLRGWSLGVVAGLATTLMFSPQGWENLRWGFQVPFIAVFAAAVVGMYALASYAAQQRVGALIVSLVCSAVAIVSLANGVFIALLMAVMAAYLKLPRRALLAHIAVALLAIPVLTAPNASPPPAGHASLLEMALYVPRYLGGGLGSVLGHAMETSLVIGVVLIALSAVAAGAVVFGPKRRDPACAALIALILFIGATAAVTAYGRAFIGPDQALAGRYAVAGSVLMIALALLITALVRDRIGAKLRIGLLVFGALVAFAIPLKGALLAQRVAGRAADELWGQTALVVGARDEEVIGHLSFNTDLAVRRSRALARAGKWHFADHWAQSVGDVLEVRGLADCPAAIVVEQRDGAFSRISGALDPRLAGQGRFIVVTNAGGRMRGYGRVRNQLADLIGGLFAPTDYPWRGHVRTPAGAQGSPRLSAYLASRTALVCRLGPVRSEARSD